MSFRRRLTLACAAAVAAAVAIGAVLTYVLVLDALHDRVDASLRQAQPLTVRLPAPSRRDVIDRIAPLGIRPTSALDGPVVYPQLYLPGRGLETPSGEPAAPLLPRSVVAQVAARRRPPFFTERVRGGQRLRIYAAPVRAGGALVVARSLEEVESTLGTLRLGLAAVVLAGAGAALLLARLATRAAVKPVVELTAAAEHVARTRDLSRRIERDGDDELSRLAAAFNTMLQALAASQRAQRRLVADASHELRTPLTSLRTNLEVLGRGGLGDHDRAALRADLLAQLEELTLLVADLVDLAREEEPVHEREAVRLDELVAGAVERAARHAPAVRFEADLEPVVVAGVPARLDRAVANVLDNAAKHSPEGGVVGVVLRGGELVVRDRGPGIASEDLPFGFDRFYRAASARGRPGSGLGLAIVRQVAEAHGGSVRAETARRGGAVLRLTLPVDEVPAPVPLLSATS